MNVVRSHRLLRALYHPSGRCHITGTAGHDLVIRSTTTARGWVACLLPHPRSNDSSPPLRPRSLSYTTTSYCPTSSKQKQQLEEEYEEEYDDDDNDNDDSLFEDDRGPKNQGLESVIAQGRSSLERTAADVGAKTKKVSSLTSDPGQSHSHKQLAERQRILEVATECLEALCQKHPQNPLALGGEPLTLLHVDVNSTARQAKIYWTLPYSLLMDPRLTPTAYQRLMKQVERTFDGNLLQRDVHTRLSFYFPPRLKFYPATPQMLAQVMHEIHHED